MSSCATPTIVLCTCVYSYKPCPQTQDTTKQRHKTAKFYGPTITTISKMVAPFVQRWITHLDYEFHPRGEPYLFSIGGDVTRCMTSTQWCATVKQAFRKWSPNATPCPPKLLRSSFITFLRGANMLSLSHASHIPMTQLP